MPIFITEYPQFFTASIKRYYKLLGHDKYKDVIILPSLVFRKKESRLGCVF